MPIRLGPFALDRRIAFGAYGHIWRGIHEPSDLPVAVKVVTESLARDPIAWDGFRREVAAVARLTHPGIIALFDYGVISDDAAGRSDGELVAGSPFLAMEFAPLGALDRRVAGATWAWTLDTLRAVLHALAHAHARGLVHRDLKPANILVMGDRPEAARPTLTDFGIAQLVDERPNQSDGPSMTRESAKGTPAFMAPEQFEGRWLDYGPWTDLYSLGVMAWELVTGTLPFPGESFIECAMLHLREPPPALEPRFAIPAGLDAWLHRLLEKRPAARFACAADALHALDTLAAQFDDPDGGAAALIAAAPVAPTLSTDHFGLTHHELVGAAADATRTNHPATATLRDPAGRPTGASGDAAFATLRDGVGAISGLDRPRHPTTEPMPPVLFSLDAPPMPASWRGIDDVQRATLLLGAGLGLYGLRTTPMVGRTGERDTLWNALATVRSTRRPRAVVLRGPTGYGKSRLAEWLTDTATEVGAAISLHAAHGPTGSPRQALVDLVSRYYRIGELPPSRMRRRIQEVVERSGATDPAEWRGLADLVAAGPGAELDELLVGTRPIRIGPRSERYAPVASMLQRPGRERPVVVWFDNVQWGGDALAFVEYMLSFDASVDLPVLFVLTGRDEALAERPQEREQLEALERRDDVESLSIGPLDPPSSRRLVEQLLYLSGGLARRVQERVGGNPLYATQLVGDWVERGLLVADRTGFRLRDGVDAPLPDDLFSLWRHRIERVLEGHDAGAREALTLCAVLGLHISDDEREHAEAHAGVALTPALRDSLLAQGLALADVAGFSFAHAMLREALLRDASERGALLKLHSACADMLLERYGPHDARVSERLVRHLLAAERRRDALVPLLLAVADHVESGEFADAGALLDEHDRILADEPDFETHGARISAALWRAHVHRNLWELNEAEGHAASAIRLARQHDDDAGRAEGLAILGHVARLRGHLQRAQDLLREALALFTTLEDRRGSALVLRAMAVTAREGSQFDLAVSHYERALAMFEALGAERDVVECLYGLGNLHRQRREFDQASAFYLRARALAEQSGNVHQIAECDNGLAEVARYAGRLDEAEALYGEALRRMTSVGSRGAVYPRLNLALTLILRGRYRAARHELQRVIPEFETSGNRGVLAWALMHTLPCEVAMGELDRAERTLDLARLALDDSSMSDTDIAEAAELGARLFAEAGRDEPAAALWRLAADQWETLGIDDRANTARNHAT